MAMPSKVCGSMTLWRSSCSTMRSSNSGSIGSMSVQPTQSSLRSVNLPPPTLQPRCSTAPLSWSRRKLLAPSGSGQGAGRLLPAVPVVVVLLLLLVLLLLVGRSPQYRVGPLWPGKSVRVPQLPMSK